MLLELKSYIRQILPPHWRNPEEIGLARVLFSPILHILREQETYEQTLLYRAGLTGQKIVLEHYLQTVVDGQITLVDEDGVKLDFAVIVPQTLTAAQKKQVYDIVQTHKLASKRFELRDAFAFSAGGGTTLGWSAGYPRVQDADKIALAVTISGSYPTRIRQRGQSNYTINEFVNYIANLPFIRQVSAAVYDIEVGGLTATLDLSVPVIRVCDLVYNDDIEQGGVSCVLESGIRKVIGYLRSAYANLDPFVFYLYNYNSVSGEVGSIAFQQGNILNPQPLTVTIPAGIAAGNYLVKYKDKDGCSTPGRVITVPSLDTSTGTCTIAYDDSGGANTAITTSVAGQQYQISVKIMLGQSLSKTLTVKRADGTLLATGGFGGSTHSLILPAGTAPQSVMVEVTEDSCSTGVRTVSLPALPPIGAVASGARMALINIQKGSNGLYSDTESDEYGDHRAWYFENDIPYKSATGGRKKYGNQPLAPGRLMIVRKIFLAPYYDTWQKVEDEMWKTGFGVHPEWVSWNCQHKFTTT